MLLGDAAGYVEPFTGEGMTWAMVSAVSIAPLAKKSLDCEPTNKHQLAEFGAGMVGATSRVARTAPTQLPNAGRLIAASQAGTDVAGSLVRGSRHRATVHSLFLEPEGAAMSFCIKGLGTAVPRHCIAQEDLAEIAGRLCGLTDKQRRMLPTLYRHAGVKKRHSVVLAGPSNKDAAGQSFYRSVDEGGPDGPTTAERMRTYAEQATPLAAQACSRALAAAQIAPSEITHLITVSCSGFAAPGVDVQLFNELGLSAGVARTHVGFMGCHGALNGLRWRGPLSKRIQTPACCSVPSSYARCTISTVGIPTRSWPTRFLPTVRPRRSACPLSRRPMRMSLFPPFRRPPRSFPTRRI